MPNVDQQGWIRSEKFIPVSTEITNRPYQKLIAKAKSQNDMTVATFKKLALSFPNSEANPHFDRVAFKIRGKRIFATLHEQSATVNLKLSPVDQSVFCTFGKKAVYPVPNKWGLQGATTFELKKVSKELMVDALDTAYKAVIGE